MTAVFLTVEGGPALEVRRLTGRERLGECSVFELEVAAAPTSAVLPAALLGKGATLKLGGTSEARLCAGVIAKSAVVMSDHEGPVVYRLRLSSRLALSGLRRLSRTFSYESVVSIIEKVVTKVGYTFATDLEGDYPDLPLVVQYQETDAVLVRRLCEEHGLFFQLTATESGEETFLLSDRSTGRDPGPTPALSLSSRQARAADAAIALAPRLSRRRAPGKVTRRDYDVEHPDVPLEGTKEDGAPEEKKLDVYQAPGGFTDAGQGTARAQLLLEALRAEATVLTFETPCFTLGVGEVFAIEESERYVGLTRPAGDYFAVALETHWSADSAERGEDDRVLVTCIPKAVPFRLEPVTPPPHVAGVQTAFVAGAEGEEIDPDELGRVYLRFHWDVHGEENPRDNPPFRVLQPQAPGGLVVPRVGWEVFASFEDGDPRRPVVLGRSYNKKQPPPVALPANKTVSSIATDSSPGAGARTVIQFDDAAGREHLLWNAPFDMTSTIANNRTTDTVGHLNEDVGTDLTETVGSMDLASIHLSWQAGYGTRGLNVGALQSINVGGNFITNVGPERVFVAGLVGEQVGNPVKGAANLAWGAAMAGVGMLGTAGAVAAGVAGLGRGMYEGYQKGGWEGAKRSAMMGAAGFGLSFIPGGDAFTAGVLGSGWANPWDHGRPAPGPAIGGGGGMSASGGDGGPVGPGPGYRNMNTDSLYVELVGARYGIATPGAVSWCTLGPSTTLVGGSATTSARSAGMMVAGGMVESLGSLNIDSKGVVSRKITGPLRSNIPGPLTINAGGEYKLNAKATLTLKVNGTLQCNGATVTFKVGGSEISASSGGVKIKAGNIKVKGASEQSGSLTHK